LKLGRFIYMWVTSTANMHLNENKHHLDWMAGPHMLVQALSRSCEFQAPFVQRIFEGVSEYLCDEQSLLGVVENSCHTREVFLSGNGKRCYFARTVIPKCTHDKYQASFEKLGDQPLGDTLLYGNKSTTWSDFKYAVIDAANDYFIKCGLDDKEEQLGARQRIFYLEGLKQFPILITEVFLPSIPEYIPELEASAPVADEATSCSARTPC
jgi:chorismate-pyruvate lyase